MFTSLLFARGTILALPSDYNLERVVMNKCFSEVISRTALWVGVAGGLGERWRGEKGERGGGLAGTRDERLVREESLADGSSWPAAAS